MSAPVTSEHGSAWDEDEWDVCGEGAHDEAWSGFVAGAEEDGSVYGLGSEEFFDLHREEVAIEHGGRLHEGFRHGERGCFEGHSPCLEDAFFCVLGEHFEVEVARVEVGPRVDDGDDGFAGPV